MKNTHLDKYFDEYATYTFQQHQYLLDDLLNNNSSIDLFLDTQYHVVEKAALTAINEIELNIDGLSKFLADCYLSDIIRKTNLLGDIFVDSWRLRVDFRNIVLHPSVSLLNQKIFNLYKIDNVADHSFLINLSLYTHGVTFLLTDFKMAKTPLLITNEESNDDIDDIKDKDDDSHRVAALILVINGIQLNEPADWVTFFKADLNQTQTKLNKTRFYYNHYNKMPNLKNHFIMLGIGNKKRLNINKKLLIAVYKKLEGTQKDYVNKILIEINDKLLIIEN